MCVQRRLGDIDVRIMKLRQNVQQRYELNQQGL
jgi:hypothetical protein